MAEFINTGSSYNVEPLANFLDKQDDLFRGITIRQNYPASAHRDTQCIYVRGPEEFTKEVYFETLSVRDFAIPSKLSREVYKILEKFNRDNRISELGRVLIVKLHPMSQLTPHIDEGYYADYFTRFHIPILTNEFCELHVDGKDQHMKAGECWWFNHKKMHTASNMHQETHRIHLIIDAVSEKFKHPNDLEEN